MEQDHAVGKPVHPLDRILSAAVHPVGVDLEEDQARVGVGEDQVVDIVVSEALKLLEVVVIVEPHAPLAGELADLVERLAAPQHEVSVPVGIELDVASDLGIAELGLVVQGARQDVEMQRVDVTAHDRQAQFAELVAELRRLDPEPDAGIVAGVVVRGLKAGEAGLSDLGQGPPRIFGERLPDRIQLEPDPYVHCGVLC